MMLGHSWHLMSKHILKLMQQTNHMSQACESKKIEDWRMQDMWFCAIVLCSKVLLCACRHVVWLKLLESKRLSFFILVVVCCGGICCPGRFVAGVGRFEDYSTWTSKRTRFSLDARVRPGGWPDRPSVEGGTTAGIKWCWKDPRSSDTCTSKAYATGADWINGCPDGSS